MLKIGSWDRCGVYYVEPIRLANWRTVTLGKAH
jgi:hypothetical protein